MWTGVTIAVDGGILYANPGIKGKVGPAKGVNRGDRTGRRRAHCGFWIDRSGRGKTASTVSP